VTVNVLHVVGLGPGGDEYVTDETRRVIAESPRRFLRTARHPSARLVADATSFDEVYENARDFDDVYSLIAERLAEETTRATAAGEGIVYAVPGSPLVLERTVRLLQSDPRLSVRLHPAMSFLDLVWARLGVDPVDDGVTLVDGHEFARRAAGLAGPLLVAHCHANWVLSDVKLAAEDLIDTSNDDLEVVLLHHLGLSDEAVVHTTWSEIDRTLEADHLTSLYVPRLMAPVGRELVSFHELARTLRRECPWDREQNHRSLVTYLLEETYEVVDAILALDADDPATDEHLVEELGDLLYQIEFHAAIAEQEGRFTMADVARGINDKLVRRHPHVFARDDSTTRSGKSLEELVTDWDAIKRAEKEARGDVGGPFDGVPRSSGSLSYAAAVLKKIEKLGVSIDVGEPRAPEHDFGAALFDLVAECRRRGIDPEVALRQTVERHRVRIEQEIRRTEN
jgi:tetrapyrrole methylase family protein/MazG family protein